MSPIQGMPERIPSAEPLQAAEAQYDMAIVGAGIVGCTLAYGLAQSGRKVLLLERDLSFQDRIVGELLQPGGCASLAQLGMLDCLDGIDARLCRGYEVYWGQQSIPTLYPDAPEALKLDFGDDGLSNEVDARMPRDSQGRAQGRSFHHGRFVQALRNKVTQSPNITLVEATVNDLVRNESGRVVGVLATPSTKAVLAASHSPSSSSSKRGLDQPLTFKAHLSMVSDGYASKFRRMVLPEDAPPPIVRSHFVALLLKDAVLPSPGCGHVILSDPSLTHASDTSNGPVLVYQLSKHDTRMLVDVPGPKLPSIQNGDLKVCMHRMEIDVYFLRSPFQKHLLNQVLPSLPASLVPSFTEAINANTKEARLRSMPNSYLPAYPQFRSKDCSGCIMVGDSLNMRHPLTGGGMTVGIGDALILTSLLGGQAATSSVAVDSVIDLENDQEAIRRAVETWYWRRKGLTGTINVLAQALYSLFAANGRCLRASKPGIFLTSAAYVQTTTLKCLKKAALNTFNVVDVVCLTRYLCFQGEFNVIYTNGMHLHSLISLI